MQTLVDEQGVGSPAEWPVILCADDDLDVMGAIELSLRNFNANLIRAFDGMNVFGEALVHKPNVIVMDLKMPFGDGITMLKCFRRNPVTERTPIIILTGMHDPGLKQRLLKMGANQFLTKPFHFGALKQALDRYITLTKRDRDAPRSSFFSA